MKIVIQRAISASVTIDNQPFSAIDKGLMLLVGIEHEDDLSDAQWLVSKIVNMRIFDDEEGVMNLSVIDIGGAILSVSQFTLQASTKKGNRPSYIKAARPEVAEPLYNEFNALLKGALGAEVAKGKFGADMQCSIVNDGPVTIIIDSKNRY